MMTIFGVLLAALLVGFIGKQLINMVKEFGPGFLVVAYVLLLAVGVSQTTDAKELVKINSLEQFVIVEQVDENTAIVENLESGELVTVDFEYNHFANGQDMTGVGVMFEKTERINPNHIKAFGVIWG